MTAWQRKRYQVSGMSVRYQGQNRSAYLFFCSSGVSMNYIEANLLRLTPLILPPDFPQLDDGLAQALTQY
jgi:hypothetical protein